MPHPVRLTGTMIISFLCECPGRPHDGHTETVVFDALSVTGANRLRAIDKTLIEKLGRDRYKKISGRQWIEGPNWLKQ